MDHTPSESTEMSFQQKCYTVVQQKEESQLLGERFSNRMTQKCFKSPVNILLNVLFLKL